MEKKYVFPIIVFLFALSFRFQFIHVPFWVDEFSSANQAMLLQKYGLGLFVQTDHYVEPRSILSTVIIATSFSIFGRNEQMARLPFELIGAFVPVMLFYFSKIVFPQKKSIWLSSVILSTTSYFLITWSRQARGYVLQEVFLLLCLMSYCLAVQYNKRSKKVLWMSVLVCSIVGGLLTHPTFVIVPLVLIVHSVLFDRRYFLKEISKKVLFRIIAAIFAIFILLLFFTGLYAQFLTELSLLVHHGLYNNLWYYHSFLWREYGLVTFLAFVGILSLCLKNLRQGALIVELIVAYLFFCCFLFPSLDSRYLLATYPLILFGMAIALDKISESILFNTPKVSNNTFFSSLLTLCLVIGIVMNGNKFDLKPNQFYSVDHDFREIALIDYDQVYQMIKAKGELEKGKTAVIDTWPDRLEWYLGLDFGPNYVFRWEDAGFMKQTPYSLQANGEKVLLQRSQTKLISTKADLTTVMSKYPKGFIWIDDTSLPAEVIDFAKTHLKKELYLDHYPLDDNPYSIWPGTLYSWGY